MRCHKSPVFLAGCLALLLTGCGPQGPQLVLKLTVAQQPLDSPRGGPAPERGQPPPGIDTFRICIQNGAGEKLVCEDFFDLTASTVRVEGIPTGKNRIVTFQGVYTDPNSNEHDVIWCGRATGVAIKESGVTPVSMLLTRCGDFTETPSLPVEARVFHTATRLLDGRVLLAGGYIAISESNLCTRPCSSLASTTSVEVFDPGDGSFAHLLDLTHPRGLHAAMLLSDGRVLIVGGCETASIQSAFADADMPGSPLRCLVQGPAATTAEILDPVAGTSQASDIPTSLFGSPVALADDHMVLVGGQDVLGNSLDWATMLNVVDLTVEVTEVPNVLDKGRRSALAVPINAPGSNPAEVLILGGRAAEDISDPGIFAERLVAGPGEIFAGVPKFVEAAAGVGLPVMHASGTRISPGRLLISGGVYPGRFISQDMPFLPKPIELAALVDMRTENFKLLDDQSQLGIPRVFHTSTNTDSFGQALVTGGFTRNNPDVSAHHQATASVEAWDEGREGFTLVWLRGEPVEMLYPRAGHTATRLTDGTILLSGGLDDSTMQVSAEIFSPFPTDLGSDGLPAL